MPNNCAYLSLIQTHSKDRIFLKHKTLFSFTEYKSFFHFHHLVSALGMGKNNGNDPAQRLIILAANRWLISRVLYYLSPPSSKVITGRACIIQRKSGLRLLSYESGLMRLMCLPHHFPHCSQRTLSPSRVKWNTLLVVSLLFLIYMRHLFCRWWSKSMSPNCSSKSKITDSLFKYVRSKHKASVKYVYSVFFPPQRIWLILTQHLILGAPPAALS